MTDYATFEYLINKFYKFFTFTKFILKYPNSLANTIPLIPVWSSYILNATAFRHVCSLYQSISQLLFAFGKQTKTAEEATEKLSPNSAFYSMSSRVYKLMHRVDRLWSLEFMQIDIISCSTHIIIQSIIN